jgi:hypothetical protein
LFPCDAVLHLKIGAQVMFIRNDTEAGAYYNGKLAIVKRIDDMGITVTFRDSGQDYTLHPEIWENFGCRLEDGSGKVIQEELGTFRQYPLRLAWAITREKIQHAHYLMLRLFGISELSAHLEPWQQLIAETVFPDEKTTVTVHEHVRAQMEAINATARKFQHQLQRLIEATASDPNGIALLK